MKIKIPEIKNKERIIWVSILILLVLVNIKIPFIGESVSAREKKNDDKYFNLFAGVYEIIRTRYVDSEKAVPDKLFYGAINGMLKALDDPHTAFLDTKRYEDLKTETTGSFGGLGIYLGKRDEWLTVLYPIEGTPAWNVGVKPGDIISEIEKQSTRDMSIEEAVSILRGTPGTTVNITILRKTEDKPLNFKIKREKIEIHSTASDLIKDSSIGYIKIKTFSATTARDLEAEISKLKTKNISALIIDLRYNPGGLLDIVCDTVDFFLTEGKIVYTKGRDGQILYEKNATPDILVPLTVPMIVLVNNYSASASEIFAGAMQDSGRALLLGEKTFGKFSVQEICQIDPGEGTAFRFTTAKYYTPKGRSLHEEGLMPDIEVKEQTFSEYETGMLLKLRRGKYIENFVSRYPEADAGEKHLKTFIEELTANNIDVREDTLRLFIKNERNRNKMPDAYDLEDDLQLREAVHLLKAYSILKK
ncbi:MAG: hypothetical protein A2096_07335 [Spirochaetes bacterium GWF1_41_5]|nr:MAG: hypothetical protein A2096_07335 [Spirochaetes bacterium GWF1_41_5]HBE02484.1 S41 family peptidase [Spirochaetia bacterium]